MGLQQLRLLRVHLRLPGVAEPVHWVAEPVHWVAEPVRLRLPGVAEPVRWVAEPVHLRLPGVLCLPQGHLEWVAETVHLRLPGVAEPVRLRLPGVERVSALVHLADLLQFARGLLDTAMPRFVAQGHLERQRIAEPVHLADLLHFARGLLDDGVPCVGPLGLHLAQDLLGLHMRSRPDCEHLWPEEGQLGAQ